MLDEMGECPNLVRGIIAAQHDICSKLQAAYELGHASLVVVGTGLDDPLKPPGSSSQLVEVLRLDDRKDAFTDALGATIPECYADLLRTQPGVVFAAMVNAMLGNARLGALIVRNLIEHADLQNVCTLSDLCDSAQVIASPPPGLRHVTVHLPTTRRLRKAMGLCVDAAIGHFRSLNAMCSLPTDQMLATLADALAIEAGAYDSASHLTDLRVKYGCLTDRARLLQRPKELNSMKDPRGIVVEGKPTSYRVVDRSDGDYLLVVPLDSYGRYRMPDAYRAMLLALAGADDIVDCVYAPQDVEAVTWVWAGLLSLLATPEHTVQTLIRLQCTPSTEGEDAWAALRPKQPFTKRNALSKTGLRAAKGHNRFFDAARALRAHDGTGRRSFVFVAAFGPDARRSPQWREVVTLPSLDVPTSGEAADSTVIMFHEGHVDEHGHLVEKKDGTRQFVYPLFLRALGKDDRLPPDHED